MCSVNDFAAWAEPGQVMVYDIKPVPKPRMTRSDRWKKRPCVLRYFDFKDAVKRLGITIPDCNYHVIFIMPMPKSWNREKKFTMDGEPHQQRPDKDNLEKALLDAIFQEDCRIWDGRCSKVWGYEGKIIITKTKPFRML